MTSEYRKKDQVYVFGCDQPGCRKNYEGEPGEFRDAWREASAHGWNHTKDYSKDGIGISRHWCPEHSKQFEPR